MMGVSHLTMGINRSRSASRHAGRRRLSDKINLVVVNSGQNHLKRTMVERSPSSILRRGFEIQHHDFRRNGKGCTSQTRPNEEYAATPFSQQCMVHASGAIDSRTAGRSIDVMRLAPSSRRMDDFKASVVLGPLSLLPSVRYNQFCNVSDFYGPRISSEDGPMGIGDRCSAKPVDPPPRLPRTTSCVYNGPLATSR